MGRFKHLLVKMMSQIHRAAMERLTKDTSMQLPAISTEGMDDADLEFVDRTVDRVECWVMWFEHTVIEHMRDGVVDVPAPILTRVFQEMNSGMVSLNRVMTIRQVPVPFPLVQVTQALLLLNWFCTPIIASLIMYNWNWA